MVVVSNNSESALALAMEQLSLENNYDGIRGTLFPNVPTVDLSEPDAKHLIVNACREFGFFKVINHGVSTVLIAKLESEALKFFSLPQSVKKNAGPYYNDKKIGYMGDKGWLENILISNRSHFHNEIIHSTFGVSTETFVSAMHDYLSAVKNMSCEILELMAEGLEIEEKNVFSKLIMDEESDSAFRINHYPPVPEAVHDMNETGFGAHTDPQIISVLRNNNTYGFQVQTNDGKWYLIPPDETSFFVNLGDSMQVMTNGRLKSVEHKVLTNTCKSRLSMIYFGSPPSKQMIAPIPSLMESEEDSLYKEFTWADYKKSAFQSRLGDNRLGPFEK